MATATKKSNRKASAAKGKAKAKAAPKGKASPKVSATVGPRAMAVLAVLAKAKQPMSRNQLADATGTNKGWAKLLGAATKGELAPNSLEARGLVLSQQYEGERGLFYSITPAGRKLVGK